MFDEQGNVTSPLKAIKFYCLDCSSGNRAVVKACELVKCPLYVFRMGHNPFRRGRELTEEERKAAAERLAKAREKQHG